MKQHKNGEKVFDVFNIVLMVVLIIIFLVPFWVVLTTSVMGPAEVARRGPYQFFAEDPDLNCYKVLLSGGSIIYNAYAVTLFRTIVGTLLNLVFTVSLAYGLAKKNLPHRKLLTLLVFFPMIFSGGLVPTYLVVHSLGIYDTIWALIFPTIISVWNTLLMRNFFMQIPESLEESAKIDGASTLCILFRIVLPLSLPSVATIGLFYAVDHWNAWFDAAMYINQRGLQPLQLILRNIVMAMNSSGINNNTLNQLAEMPPTESMKCAAIMVTTIPILCVYPFIQKYFVKGIMVGSVKG